MVERLAIFFIVVCVGGLFFSGYMLMRNGRVASERMRLLEVVSLLCYEDINQRKPWMPRYDAWEIVSYDDMMWQLTCFRWALNEDGMIVPARSL